MSKTTISAVRAFSCVVALYLLFSQVLHADTAGATSLVPADQAISDYEAGLALARALAAISGGRSEAAVELTWLLQENPEDPRLLLELADMKISGGSYRTGRDLYNRALAAPGADVDGIGRRLAERQLMWGDFYAAENFWRERWLQDPADSTAALRLAAALLGSDRYDDAAAVYRKLIRQHPELAAAWRGLADVAMLQRKFEEALEVCKILGALPEQKAQAALIRGRALHGLKDTEAAALVLTELTGNAAELAEAQVRLGILLAEAGERERAEAYFTEALRLRPDYVEAAYRLAGPGMVSNDDFRKQLVEAEDNPETLCRWAGLYTADGFYEYALMVYEAVLEREPDYFPAAEARAFVLAVSRRYEKAAETYAEMLDHFPGNRKLLIGRARALAWGRKYPESLEVFDVLEELQPQDLVARREAARAALWGKMYQNGRERYQAILEPGVDRRLLEALQPLRAGLAPELLQELERLEEMAEDDPGGCEIFARCLELLAQEEPPPVTDDLLDVLDDLRGLYETQLRVDLEVRYKRKLWHRQYARALHTSGALVKLSPADQEVRFDHAQAACNIGLCDCAMTQYRELLRVDPTHLIAGEALKLGRLDSRPALRLSGWYWREQGRGELSDIRRQELTLSLEIPVFCRTRFDFERQRSRERPRGSSAINAWRHTVGFGGVFNPYLQGEIRLSRKKYDRGRFPHTSTGQANLWLNLDDDAHVGIGYERSDELYNRFGFPQKAQADNWWLEAKSDLTRKWDAALRLKRSDYNDNNHKDSVRLATGHVFTDHPRMFKATVSAEYQDTRRENRFIYAGPVLMDIIYPYWTPQNHLGTALTLEWRHDLSHPQYCGNREHFYGIRVTFGSDSDNSAGVDIEVEWHWRFSPRWSVETRGTWHNSREWDGTGLWLMLKCRL